MWALSLLAVSTAAVLAACEPDSTNSPASASPSPTSVATPLSTDVLAPTPTPIATAATDVLVLRVGAGKFIVEVVDDTIERAAGLSGRDSLAEGTGMWFAYPAVGQPSFWMRDMRFPVDLVWVDASLRVVAVTHQAPSPPAGATVDDLPLYSPGAPIMYVLEINAGQAVDLGIEAGALVSLESP